MDSDRARVGADSAVQPSSFLRDSRHPARGAPDTRHLRAPAGGTHTRTSTRSHSHTRTHARTHARTHTHTGTLRTRTRTRKRLAPTHLTSTSSQVVVVAALATRPSVVRFALVGSAVSYWWVYGTFMGYRKEDPDGLFVKRTHGAPPFVLLILAAAPNVASVPPVDALGSLRRLGQPHRSARRPSSWPLLLLRSGCSRASTSAPDTASLWRASTGTRGPMWRHGLSS